MSSVLISAEVRNTFGKGAAHQLRRTGKIPAIYYGKGQENLHVAINPLDLEKAVASEMGLNTIIQLKVSGKEYNVLLKDYQAHPIKRNFLHADFIFVDLTKKVEIEVPIHLTGKSVGVKEGGILEQIAREIKVSCLPNQIPKQIEVDITNLKIGDNFHMEEIKWPAGVEPVEKLNVPIAAVIAQREEEATPTAGAMVEPEVLTAKKEGDEAAAGAKDAKAPAAPKAAEKK